MNPLDLVRSRFQSLPNGWRPNATVALLLLASVLCLTATPVAAHDWQTTVTNGEYELGINSAPVSPVAGVETAFVARLSDSNVEGGERHRLNGGVVNKTVEVAITGPDGTTDHLEVDIPRGNPHFHFSYTFLEEGVYEITVTAPLDGEDVSFEARREVSLLPTNASGAQIDRLNRNMAALKDSVTTLKWVAGGAALFALIAALGALFTAYRID